MRATVLLLCSLVAVSTAIVTPTFPKITYEAELEGGDYKNDFKELLEEYYDCFYLRFNVKAIDTIYIQFSVTNEASEKSYEVMIGVGQDNTCIRKGTGDNYLIDKNTGKVLTGEWQSFYIRYSRGLFEIGFVNGDQIASAYDKEAYPVKYFRIRSKAESQWEFFLPILGRNDPITEVIEEPENPESIPSYWNYPKLNTESFKIVVGVSAIDSASIIFSEVNEYASDILKIVFAAEYNTFLCLVRKKGQNPIVDKLAVNYLDAAKFRYFWIEYTYPWLDDKSKLEVGLVGDETALISFVDDHPLKIQYFGLESKSSSRWEIYLPCYDNPGGCKSLEKPYKSPKIYEEFDLGPDQWRFVSKQLLDDGCWYLRFRVKATNTIYIQLSSTQEDGSDESYVVTIDDGENKATRIRKGNDYILTQATDGIITGAWQEFYIRHGPKIWEIGYVAAGNVEIATIETDHEFDIKYVGVKSKEKSWWKFDLPGFGRREIRHDIHHPGKYAFVFPELYQENFYLVFSTKTFQDASLVLSSTNGYGDDSYELIIGEANKDILLLRKKDEVRRVECRFILDGKRFRYFWLSYNNGHLRFGRWGEEEPLLEFEDEEPIAVKHFGITSRGNKSWWRFYTPCPEPFFVCQNENVTLSCPNGFIRLKSALFGRENKAFCRRANEGFRHLRDCGDPKHSYELVRQQCFGKPECTIEITNEFFTNPCPGTYKYLKVDYDCCHCD